MLQYLWWWSPLLMVDGGIRSKRLLVLLGVWHLSLFQHLNQIGHHLCIFGCCWICASFFCGNHSTKNSPWWTLTCVHLNSVSGPMGLWLTSVYFSDYWTVLSPPSDGKLQENKSLPNFKAYSINLSVSRLNSIKASVTSLSWIFGGFLIEGLQCVP